MRLRRVCLAFLLVLISLATPGCLWCRPWGWHCHRCCYLEPGPVDPSCNALLVQTGEVPRKCPQAQLSTEP
jgi:hypothetical protein